MFQSISNLIIQISVICSSFWDQLQPAPFPPNYSPRIPFLTRSPPPPWSELEHPKHKDFSCLQRGPTAFNQWTCCQYIILELRGGGKNHIQNCSIYMKRLKVKCSILLHLLKQPDWLINWLKRSLHFTQRGLSCSAFVVKQIFSFLEISWQYWDRVQMMIPAPVLMRLRTVLVLLLLSFLQHFFIIQGSSEVFSLHLLLHFLQLPDLLCESFVHHPLDQEVQVFKGENGVDLQGDALQRDDMLKAFLQPLLFLWWELIHFLLHFFAKTLKCSFTPFAPSSYFLWWSIWTLHGGTSPHTTQSVIAGARELHNHSSSLSTMLLSFLSSLLSPYPGVSRMVREKGSVFPWNPKICYMVTSDVWLSDCLVVSSPTISNQTSSSHWSTPWFSWPCRWSEWTSLFLSNPQAGWFCSAGSPFSYWESLFSGLWWSPLPGSTGRF